MKKLFRFCPTKDTGIAALAGIAVIALSLLMLFFDGDTFSDTILSFLLRDVLMIFGLGVVFVSLYVEKKGDSVLEDLGFTKRKWKISVRSCTGSRTAGNVFERAGTGEHPVFGKAVCCGICPDRRDL